MTDELKDQIQAAAQDRYADVRDEGERSRLCQGYLAAMKDLCSNSEENKRMVQRFADEMTGDAPIEFGAWVRHNGVDCRLICNEKDPNGRYTIARENQGFVFVENVLRQEFRVLHTDPESV